MDYPINDYYINSARNVYICNLNLAKLINLDGMEAEEWESKLMPLYFVIKKGIRYLEIDVWVNKNNKIKNKNK